jgi:hypothetical protein
MDVEELRGFMRTPFQKEKVRMAPYSYVMQEFSFENELYYERKKNDDTVMNTFIKCSNLDVALTPQMVEDCSQLCEMFQNYFLSKDLKQYRPHRRPIILDDKQKKEHWAASQPFKRKRRLIIRDWFFYVVWYNRLKKLIQNMYDTELLQQELEGHSKYQKLMELIEKKDANVEDLKAEF